MLGGEMAYGARVRIVMQIFFENRNKTRRRVTVEDSRMLLPSIAELQKQQQQQHHRQSQSIVTMMMYL